MPSICQQRLDVLIKKIHPYLKGIGFRKTGHTYNKVISNPKTSSEFTQVLNYQLSSVNNWQSCKFTVNLGVWVHAMHPNLFRKVIPEYFCDFRERISELETGTDTWYELLEETDALAQALQQSIQNYAVPWLDTYASYEGITAGWDALDPDLQKSQFGTAKTMIDFFIKTQQIERAKHIIEQQYLYNLELFPSRSERMVKLAESLGFSLNSP